MNYAQMKVREYDISQSQANVRENDQFQVHRANLKSQEGDNQDSYGQKEQEAPVKSVADLGFMTEVDTDFRPPTKTRDDSQISDRAGSTTKMSDLE